MKKVPTLISVIALCLLTLSITSCKKDGDETTSCTIKLKDQVATGKFMGDEFTVIDGYAEDNPFKDNSLRINLYGVNASGDKCDDWNFNRPDSSIIFSLPNKIGTYPLSLDRIVSFNKSELNKVTVVGASCGEIKITAISNSEISGKIAADANDSKNIINGNFTIVFCPEVL